MEREKFRIPRSVQDAIPIRRIFADGIFQVGNQYSKTWSFTDINYAIASKEDKTSMFLDYSELLNALDSGASAKITIYNRRINKAEFERSVLLPDKDDGLDEYRHEFNQMLTAQVTGTSNSIVRERYLTVSVVKRNADEARSYFARVGTDLVTHLAQLSSVATELTLNERLHIFRDFFKAGEQAAAEFNIHEHAKRGQHFKDWFCPDSMEFSADHFKLDARYGRVLYCKTISTMQPMGVTWNWMEPLLSRTTAYMKSYGRPVCISFRKYRRIFYSGAALLLSPSFRKDGQHEENTKLYQYLVGGKGTLFHQ